MNQNDMIRKLYEERISLGISQKEIADKSSISPSQLSKIENGITKNPGYHTILAYETALNALKQERSILSALQNILKNCPNKDEIISAIGCTPQFFSDAAENKIILSAAFLIQLCSAFKINIIHILIEKLKSLKREEAGLSSHREADEPASSHRNGQDRVGDNSPVLPDNNEG